jgi:hypothetical protein
MADFEVLDALTSADVWQDRLDMLPEEARDIYFQPDYGLAYASGKTDQYLLFCFQQEERLWAYAFLKRKLPDHLRTPGTNDWFDLESPYGYSGPVANTNDNLFLESANKAFDEWCLRENIVAEFIRLHPLLNNLRWVSSRAESIADRKTVSLDLTGEESDAYSISKNGFEMVKKARRSGLELDSAGDPASFADFFRLYEKTMRRLEADQFYFFSNEHFTALMNIVKSNGWLITCCFEGKMVSAAIFLRGTTWMHYHLSASDPDNRMPGSMNAIIFEAARIGKSSDLTKLHLGGGTTAEDSDSLFKFKRKMATDEHQFSVSKRVHNPDVYEEIVDRWRNQFPKIVSSYGSRVLCYRYGSPESVK